MSDSSIVKLGLGQFGNNSHPIHAASIHAPLALTSFAFIVDAYTLAAASLPRALLSYLPPPANLTLVSHYATAAGVLSALPAVSTGLIELFAMWSGKQKEKPAKDVVQDSKVSTTLIHAFSNEASLAIAAYNWYTRYSHNSFILPKFNLWLSVLGLPLLFFGAYKGGELVYQYGVGVQRQGDGAAMKKAQKKD